MTTNALAIVNESLQELGLPQVVTILSAQDDQTGFQTLGLLNRVGSELVRAHDWQFLERTATFNGDGVQNKFPLPIDYGRIVNQTTWSTANKRPMYGPMSPQGWSWIQYGIVSVGVYYRYRILDNMLQVFPTPAMGEIIHFFYITRMWVTDLIDGDEKDRVTKDTDLPKFDKDLMIAGTKLKLWKQKGMDASDLSSEFAYMLEAEKGQNQGAPVISLDSRCDHLYISGANVPDGSWSV